MKITNAYIATLALTILLASGCAKAPQQLQDAPGVLDTGLAERMLQWRHSRFSVHNRIRSRADDADSRQRLARFMIRYPFTL